ncbi:XRE family transcriptional regulator, partial [Streptomyces sp. NPDC013489]
MATALESTTAKQHRLGELREFLMSRRARVSPAEAGLPDGGARRRT